MSPVILLNGSTIPMPAEHGWLPPESLGRDANNRETLPALWDYYLNWDALTPSEFRVVFRISYLNQSTFISAYLPVLAAEDYSTFATYTDCAIDPVTFSRFYEGHYMDVRAKLTGIDIS